MWRVGPEYSQSTVARQDSMRTLVLASFLLLGVQGESVLVTKCCPEGQIYSGGCVNSTGGNYWLSNSQILTSDPNCITFNLGNPLFGETITVANSTGPTAKANQIVSPFKGLTFVNRTLESKGQELPKGCYHDKLEIHKLDFENKGSRSSS